MPRNRHIEFSRSYLLMNYIALRRSMSQIAEEKGVTQDTVRYWLRKHEIPTMPRVVAGRSGSRLSREYLVKRYLVDQVSTCVIAEEAGVAAASVRYWMQKHGISLRTLREARPLSNTRRRLLKARVKDGNGYWQMIVHGHPRANRDGYVREHVLVWEKVHRKQLPPGMIVHHIDGNIESNRPKNLRAFTKSEHSLFHIFTRKKAQTGRSSAPREKLRGYLREWDRKKTV